jgi:hypothetical protein
MASLDAMEKGGEKKKMLKPRYRRLVIARAKENEKK